MQGSLLYQCILNQLKVSLVEGSLKYSALPRTLNSPHPNCPLIITCFPFHKRQKLGWRPGISLRILAICNQNITMGYFRNHQLQYS